MINIDNQQFSTYKLSGDILQTLDLLGYHIPTQIQQEVIPAVLDGKSVVAKAPTGSGKTAAFAIPICEKIMWEENAPQALILEPTRELAVQVKDEVFHIGRKKRIKVPAVFGGFPIDKQIQTLRQKSHIVVGTPGRVMDHIRRGSLKLEQIAFVVIDEADLMLDMGFMEDVKEILSLIPSGANISLFSATLKPAIQKIVEEYIQDACLIIQDAPLDVSPAITERLYEVKQDDKYQMFQQILIKENPECCLIFCGTREMVNVLFQKLRRHRIFCGMIHGEMEQKDRLKTIEAFRRGGFRFLIATDVAARGIDLDHMTHVINYDFPTGKETYVHRIGRTGRNGKTGTAISIVTDEDLRMLQMIREYAGRDLPLEELPDISGEEEKHFWKCQRIKAELTPSKGAVLSKGIVRLSVGGGRKSKMRAGDIVGAICSIDGLTMDDIGIVDIRDSLSYVEVLNQKGTIVLDALQNQPIKGKIRKVRITRGTGM